MHDPDKMRLFEVLAKEHEPMLMAYIQSLVCDPMLAEDIAQQSLLTAFRKISTLRRSGSFPAWLRGIDGHLDRIGAGGRGKRGRQ